MNAKSAGRKTSIVLVSTVALVLGLGLGYAVSGVGRDADHSATMTPSPPPAVGAAPPVVTGAPDFRGVVKSVLPSVVTVRSQRTVQVSRTPFSLPPGFEQFFGQFQQPGQGEKRIERGLGSGVIVDPAGYVLTNNHVIEGMSKIEVVVPDGKVLPATIKGADPQTDLAVLQVDDPGLKAIPLGRSADLEVGEWVLAIGNPFAEALAHTVTAGIVSAVGRSNLRLADYEDFIQTDAAINPGNSGGALVNTRGELVGINTAIISGSGGYQGIGFAIPIDMARQIMDTLIDKGKVVRGWLGVSIQDVTPEMAKAAGFSNDKGVIVASVSDKGPAAAAGIRQGDIILELDGHEIEDTIDLRNRVASSAPGSRVRLSVERDGSDRTIDVTLGELPSEGDQAAPESGATEEGYGMSLRNLTPEIADQLGISGEKGVVIDEVESGSAADSAGLRRGDVIQQVNRKRITSLSEFRAEITKSGGSNAILLLVRRGGNTFYVTVQKP